MENAFGIALAPIPATKKAAAKVALVDLKEPARGVLADCFRQFGIDAESVDGDAAIRLQTEKFEACVLKLSPESECVMGAARNSSSNARMVIYGVGGSAQDALGFSKYGINAIFNEPLERSTALKLVRATQMLVMHEFRRYVRLPIITEVTVTAPGGRKLKATSREISSGGMSIRLPEDLNIGSGVEISFALLTLPRIWVRGTIAWRSKDTFGIRFDPSDDRRIKIKEWVEAYLEC
jgi:PilZ domain